MTESEVPAQISEAFELNYERLRLEGGHALTGDLKKLAIKLVLLYWKKMPEVAEKITETEVKLSLPGRESPKGRKFSIEGIVDIVKEKEETWMYDIKSHDAGYVKDHLDQFERQLNVYWYIWNELRKKPLDHTAIISLFLPEALSAAIRSDDEAKIAEELAKWNPLMEIPLNKKHVKETVDDFGSVVDAVESNEFAAVPVSKLRERGHSGLFATRVCRNCDARFSCPSYRKYAVGSSAKPFSAYKKYIDDLGPEDELEARKTINLEAAVIPDAVEISE
jgi:hypothetical protein